MDKGSKKIKAHFMDMSAGVGDQTTIGPATESSSSVAPAEAISALPADTIYNLPSSPAKVKKRFNLTDIFPEKKGFFRLPYERPDLLYDGPVRDGEDDPISRRY